MGFESLNELTYATKASFSCLDIAGRRALSGWKEGEWQGDLTGKADYLGDLRLRCLARYCSSPYEEQTPRVGGDYYVIFSNVIQPATRLICGKRDITQLHSHLVLLLTVRRPLDILNQQHLESAIFVPWIG